MDKIAFSILDTETKSAKPLKLIDEPVDRSYRDRVAAYVAQMIEGDEPLTKLDLSGARLSGMNLSGRDFTGCDLFGADLSGCNLRGANFSSCNMLVCNVSDADLTDAVFAGADVRGLHAADAIGLPKDLDISMSDTPRSVKP